jgi:hypothetical protein
MITHLRDSLRLLYERDILTRNQMKLEFKKLWYCGHLDIYLIAPE